MTDNNGPPRLPPPPPPPPGLLVGFPTGAIPVEAAAAQQQALFAAGIQMAPQVPVAVGTAQEPAGRRSCGRRGDMRMHLAVEVRLANPKMALVDALKQGGFVFPRHGEEGQSDRTIRDLDGILLYQRKNQLNRRLRIYKKQNGLGNSDGFGEGGGANIVDDNGDESDDEREDDDDEEGAEGARRKRKKKSKSASKKKKKRRSKKSGHRSSSSTSQQPQPQPMGMPVMPPLGSMSAQFGAGAPQMQMPQMDPASMAQFQQAFMAQQINIMQQLAATAAAANKNNNTNNAGGNDGEGAGAPSQQPPQAAAMSPAMLGALMATNPMMLAAFQPQQMAQGAMMQAAAAAGKGPRDEDGDEDGDADGGDGEQTTV